MARPAPISTRAAGRRHRGGERATRQFHATAGRHARRSAERRDRRDAGARDAPRAGGRGVAARNLVAIRRPQRPRASVCRGGARAAQSPAPRPQPRPLQRARSRRIGPASISTLPGRLDMRVLEELDVPRDADFYICGPSAFMSDLTAGLAAWGVARRSHPHRAVRRRSVHHARASRLRRAGRRICRQGLPARDRWFRSPAAASMSAGDRPSRACSSSPRPATCRCDGRAAPGSATPARPGLWRGRSATSRTRSMRRRTAMC